MYWRQVVLSLVFAGSGAYTAYARGRPAVEAVLFGVIFYVGIRWLIAWGYRIRYWYHRGTRGVYTETCPNCRLRRHRLSGDWILKCHTCGWKPGWFGIRWLRKSLPAQQLRRTVVSPQLLVLVAAIAVITTGAASGFVLDDASFDLDDSGIGVKATDLVSDPSTPVKVGAQETETSPPSGKLNETRVERLLFEYVNSKRGLREMQNFSYHERSARAAEDHADDMAENDYFSHTSLDGVGQQERYSFCSGGENIAQTWVDRDVRLSTGEVESYNTEKELAKGLVKQWMNSEPHRERGIYGKWWQSAGVGVSITSTGEVYAVMGFCSS